MHSGNCSSTTQGPPQGKVEQREMTGDEHTLELGGAVEAEAIHESQPGQRGQVPGKTAEWAARLTGAAASGDGPGQRGRLVRPAGRRAVSGAHTLETPATLPSVTPGTSVSIGAHSPQGRKQADPPTGT